jgi:CheY-like chemotaxis protein
MRRRILLADDSVTIQKVIELTFMDEDYEVKAVSNGDDAIRAMPEVEPDFVIADVHMPGANGYEVCRRSKERRPEVPVLLLVGTFEPFDEAQARAAGADSYLKKPFDSQELLQRVAELLAARQGAETVRAPVLPLSTSEMGSGPETEAPPFPPIPEWRGFELEAEPEPLGASGEAFTLEEEPASAWQGDTYVPEGESMFELEQTAAPAPPGDVFGFEAFPPPTDTERLGVPEPAAPLVSSLEETERRIEAPPPPSLERSHEPAAAVPVAGAAAAAVSGSALGQDGGLSDADVDRIARRVVELLGDKAVRDVAWEVVPDLAECVIRDRLRELESQAESLE